MRAYMEIKIEAGSNILGILEAVRSVEGVKDASAVTGHVDIIVSLEAIDLHALTEIITKIHAIKGVKDTETMICIE